MITILSALGGLATSLLPDVIHGWFAARQDQRDKAQELALVQAQLALESAKSEGERAAQAGRIAEINAQAAAAQAQAAAELERANLVADIAEAEAVTRRGAPIGVTWVDALNASVRPTITYLFCALFAWHIGAAILGHPATAAWNEDVQALFAGILGFWFGARAMKNARGK